MKYFGLQDEIAFTFFAPAIILFFNPVVALYVWTALLFLLLWCRWKKLLGIIKLFLVTRKKSNQKTGT